MRTLSIGLVLPTGDVFVDGPSPRWVEIRDLALRAEAIGFDTVWVADELLWRPAEGPPQGFWECVAMTGALAAATSRIKVGTWILSALHRNPGITAKAVETLDEVSGGQFIFGLGAGHAGRQAHAFGLPEDHVVGRFEEAVEIIVPLLRAGRADVAGSFHAAHDLEQRPVGPRPGRIPIMIGAKGPRMLRVAARHADIWSWYAEERSDVEEFGPLLEALVAACRGGPRSRDDRPLGRHRRRANDHHRLRGEGLRRADPRLLGRDRRATVRLRGQRVHAGGGRALASDAGRTGRHAAVSSLDAG